jgi:hypothetical protein
MTSMQASPTVARGPRADAASTREATRRPPRLDPLAREITAVLAVKLGAILLLWFAFFRPGDAPQPSPSAESVARHIAAPAPPPEVPVAAH